jgi:predicted glycosyl hydrolase (DUF1957 family)
MRKREEYLQRAKEAERLAERALDSKARETLETIAEQWRSLAAYEDRKASD